MKLNKIQKTKDKISISLALAEYSNKEDDIIIITLFNFHKFQRYKLEIDKKLKDLPDSIAQYISIKDLYEYMVKMFDQIKFNEDGSIVFTLRVKVDSLTVSNTIYLKAVQEQIDDIELLKQQFQVYQEKLEKNDFQKRVLKIILVISVVVISLIIYSFFSKYSSLKEELNIEKEILHNLINQNHLQTDNRILENIAVN